MTKDVVEIIKLVKDQCTVQMAESIIREIRDLCAYPFYISIDTSYQISRSWRYASEALVRWAKCMSFTLVFHNEFHIGPKDFLEAISTLKMIFIMNRDFVDVYWIKIRYPRFRPLAEPEICVDDCLAEEDESLLPEMLMEGQYRTRWSIKIERKISWLV